MTDRPDDSGPAPISVVLVDDHALVRDGVREILEAEGHITVVGEAATGPEGVATVALRRPDIVLLDVELPGGEATDTVAAMRRVSPGSQIIILSMYDGPQLLRRLIAAGIRGYLLKSVDRRELVAAVCSVHSGPERIVLAVSQTSLAQMQAGEGNRVLSDRETEILELVAQAMSNSQVARRLTLTEATVKRHLRNVFVKLGAVSRIDAVNKALNAGLIGAPREHLQSPRPPGRA